MMLIIKMAAAIVLAFVVFIALAIVVFFISRIITVEMDGYKERRNKNGKQN